MDSNAEVGLINRKTSSANAQYQLASRVENRKYSSGFCCLLWGPSDVGEAMGSNADWVWPKKTPDYKRVL